MRIQVGGKANAVALLGLSTVLVFAKYHLARLPTYVVFGRDPGDAVTHFGFLTILLIAAASLIRVFRPARESPGSSEENLYLIRSQQAFVIAVSTTFTANLVDLARHPCLWASSASRNEMLAWLALFPAVAITMQWLVQGAQRTTQKNAMRVVALVVVGVLAILSVCPQWGTGYSSESGHIFTVSVGGLVLLVPMRLLLPVLVPQDSSVRHNGRALSATRREWRVLAIGVALFGAAFVSELHKFRMISLIGGICITYAFLAEPLGFMRDRIGRVRASVN